MPWWILQNRYVVTFGLIGLAALLWNVYIAFNDDGVIEGRVVGPDGRPVAGATVILSERSLLVTAPRDHRRGRPLRLRRPWSLPALPRGAKGWCRRLQAA